MWIRSLQKAGVLPAIGVLYLFGLWNSSVPLTGDQKTYVSIAMEMRSRSEWLIPQLFDRANFLKPPFQYWATLLGWKALGFNVFATLFPSVLALLGSAVLVRALSPDRSWTRALLFSGTLSVMTYGTTAQMEIWILLFYLLCWHLLLQGRWVSAWLSAGIMAWIKGPLYPVLWAGGVACHGLMREGRRFRISRKQAAGVAAGTGVGLLWYGLAARTHLEQMLDVFMMRENVGKWSTRQGTALGLWSEFLATLFPMLPWFVASLFTKEFRTALRDQRSFWISYGLLPALFFTFFPYRVSTYLFILVPVAVWCIAVTPGAMGPRLRGILTSVTAIVGITLLGLLWRLHEGDWISTPLMIGFALAIALWIHGHARLQVEWVGAGALLIVTAVRLLGAELGERDLNSLRAAWSTRPGEVGYALQGEDIWHEFGQVSVALGVPVQLLRTEEDRNLFLARGGLLVLNDEQSDLAQGLRCDPWSRMRRRLKFPVRDLFLKGLSFQDRSLRRTFLLCRAPGS
jgi:4-amino-4-deoxy-L-arabinose transferase-like glycosyltransferase